MTANVIVKGGLYAQYADTLQLIGGKRVIDRAIETSPIAVTAPNWIGERIFDRASSQIWQAVGLLNTDWVPIQLALGKTSPEILGSI